MTIAVETGHLVFGTLHTTSATKSLDRILDALPPDRREQSKMFLAQNLHAVVTQALVKTADGRGRKAVIEIMLATNAIANLILSDKVYQPPHQTQTGRDKRIQLMDRAFWKPCKRRKSVPMTLIYTRLKCSCFNAWLLSPHYCRG